MESASQRSVRILKNDKYLKELEHSKASLYLRSKPLYEQNIGLRHLEEFSQAASQLLDVYYRYQKTQQALQLLLWQHQTLRNELFKPARKDFFIMNCRKLLAKISQQAELISEKLGNLQPFLMPLPSDQQAINLRP